MGMWERQSGSRDTQEAYHLSLSPHQWDTSAIVLASALFAACLNQADSALAERMCCCLAIAPTQLLEESQRVHVAFTGEFGHHTTSPRQLTSEVCGGHQGGTSRQRPCTIHTPAHQLLVCAFSAL